jgi:hypothetical protein
MCLELGLPPFKKLVGGTVVNMSKHPFTEDASIIFFEGNAEGNYERAMEWVDMEEEERNEEIEATKVSDEWYRTIESLENVRVTYSEVLGASVDKPALGLLYIAAGENILVDNYAELNFLINTSERMVKKINALAEDVKRIQEHEDRIRRVTEELRLAEFEEAIGMYAPGSEVKRRIKEQERNEAETMLMSIGKEPPVEWKAVRSSKRESKGGKIDIADLVKAGFQALSPGARKIRPLAQAEEEEGGEASSVSEKLVPTELFKEKTEEDEDELVKLQKWWNTWDIEPSDLVGEEGEVKGLFGSIVAGETDRPTLGADNVMMNEYVWEDLVGDDEGLDSPDVGSGGGKWNWKMEDWKSEEVAADEADDEEWEPVSWFELIRGRKRKKKVGEKERERRRRKTSRSKSRKRAQAREGKG